MICNNCGNTFEDGNRFCPYCGTPVQIQQNIPALLNQVPPLNQAPPQNSMQPQNPVMKKIVLIRSFLAVII